MDRLRGSVAFVVSLLLCLNAQLLFAQGIHVKGVVRCTWPGDWCQCR
ncbi:MAG: hypothetical protein ACI378_11665 [Bacteroides sp.]